MGVWERCELVEKFKGRKRVFTEPQETSKAKVVLREDAAEIQ